MLAAVVLMTASAAAVPLQVRFDNSEFSQVVYNVSCMSRRLACTFQLIDKFWREQLRWTAEDQRQLDAWRATLGTVASRQPKPEAVPFLPNYAGYYPELTAVNRLIAAGLNSRSARGFRRHAAGFAAPGEVEQLAGALQHFERRMRRWWKSKGSRYLSTRGKAIEAGMRDPKFSALAGRIARFMESEFAGRDFRVHLIARGDPGSDQATATFVGNHVVLELTDTMDPVGAHSIVVHEMTHAFYDTAPRNRHQQLIRDFAAAKEPQAQCYYMLLNEGLATGVQFMLLRQSSKDDKDAYRHAYIPRIGRAVSPLIEQALNSGNATLFNGFVEPYLRAGAAEMKEEAGSPKFALAAVALASVGEANLKAAEEAFRSEFAVIGYTDFGDRQRYRDVNLAMLLAYADIGAVESTWPEMRQLVTQHRAFAFVAPRGAGKGLVFVLAGADGDAVAEIVRKLAATPAMPKQGIVASLPYK